MERVGAGVGGGSAGSDKVQVEVEGGEVYLFHKLESKLALSLFHMLGVWEGARMAGGLRIKGTGWLATLHDGHDSKCKRCPASSGFVWYPVGSPAPLSPLPTPKHVNQ